MDIAQKALYNSLRISWLQDKSVAVEPWKVEDYRSLEIDALFSRLQENEIYLDRHAFKTYGEQFDTPEEMAEWLIGAEEFSPEEYDRIYLVIFELWRRLLPEKPSISTICDELDAQIFAYDHAKESQKKEDLEALQDAISAFHILLEENVDVGMEPVEVFSTLLEFCANDIEHFLYDYIADQLDVQDYDYAEELIDNFYPFILDKSWFDLLKARLFYASDLEQANSLILHVYEENKESEAPSIALSFEMLALLVAGGNYHLFLKIALHAMSLLECEEDFIELLTIAADFFHRLDDDKEQEKIEKIMARRSAIHPEKMFEKDDADLAFFKQELVTYSNR
jgi:hypothetical protein